MDGERDNAMQIEDGRPNVLDDIEAKGYADAAIQKQNNQILDGTAEAHRLERKYMRRLDMIILPTISVLYFFKYLGRGNVAVSGMDHGFDALIMHMSQ